MFHYGIIEYAVAHLMVDFDIHEEICFRAFCIVKPCFSQSASEVIIRIVKFSQVGYIVFNTMVG